MDYEVDFLAVGDGERSGDAIALRFGNFKINPSDQTVVVIDGGTKETGEELVRHIQKYYGTNSVDLVVSSHPDSDHASGLSVVLEKLKVKGLWLHKPWDYSEDIKNLFNDGRITAAGLEDRFRKNLEAAHELEKIALQKKIPIYEPFSDAFNDANAPVIVLGPSRDFYLGLLPCFRCCPEPRQEALSLLQQYMTGPAVLLKEAVSFVIETIYNEVLSEPEDNATSAENNSGTVILFQIDGKKLLFTADAGVPALTEAVNKAEKLGIDLKTASFVQVPHHGSRRNVGPNILNRIIGPKLSQFEKHKTAFVSCAKEGAPKHPSKKVTNAFKRRGTEIHVTQGSGKWHHSSGLVREGWVASIPVPFFDRVEE